MSERETEHERQRRMWERALAEIPDQLEREEKEWRGVRKEEFGLDNYR